MTAALIFIAATASVVLTYELIAILVPHLGWRTITQWFRAKAKQYPLFAPALFGFLLGALFGHWVL